MPQQKAGYPIDYSKGSADAGKDRLREMADVAIDKMKEVTRAPRKLQARSPRRPASTEKRPKTQSRISSHTSRNQ